MYDNLMKSQLTVIADQAVVKVLKLTRKSKKYLSDPLKAMIDNKTMIGHSKIRLKFNNSLMARESGNITKIKSART